MKRILLVIAAACAALQIQAQSQPIDPNTVEVSGYLIDVRTVSKKGWFFPQWEKTVPDDDLIRTLGEGRKYAVSLAEYRGPEKVRCGRNERCLIALDYNYEMPKGWEATGESFFIGGATYYIYEYTKVKTGVWVDVPYPEGCTRSAVVFGRNITVVDTHEYENYGTVICKVPELRKKNAFNQCMTILPDGSYLACCTMGMGPGPMMFISTDKGKTWAPHGDYDVRKNKVGNQHNLFMHRGVLYFMGVGAAHDNIWICKSNDGGLTWSKPVDSKTGLLFEGLFHTAPVPMAIADGRIWRACETFSNTSSEKWPFMISAPEDSDLLDASNWTMTNTVGLGLKKIEGHKMTGSLIEGNAVVMPDGKVVNLIRTNSTYTSDYATILHTEGVDSLYFDPEKDWIHMPGGGKKFTVRFDPVTNLYWTITNPDDGSKDYTHLGVERKGGINHSLIRNRLVLICSPDVIHWKECKTLMYDPDPFFHGFQYADWMFEGDDIVSVVRVGAPESRGLPNRQHDSNMMTFIRIENFRELAK